MLEYEQRPRHPKKIITTKHFKRAKNNDNEDDVGKTSMGFVSMPEPTSESNPLYGTTIPHRGNVRIFASEGVLYHKPWFDSKVGTSTGSNPIVVFLIKHLVTISLIKTRNLNE